MKNHFIIHPLLFAIFPVISLFAHNKDMVSYAYLLQPTIISVFITIVVFFIVYFFSKNINKSALSASIFIFMFFSFGPLLDWLSNFHIGIVDILTHYIFLIIFLCLFVFLNVLIFNSKKSLSAITATLNIVAIIMVSIPILSFTYYKMVHLDNNHVQATHDSSPIITSTKTTKVYPDIYYIILDAYARNDVLKNLYNYNNSEFTNWLISNGFYIASSSRANYMQTYLSVASSLNYEYLDNVSKKASENSNDRSFLKKMIKNNKVVNFLRSHGYKFVIFPCSWSGYNGNFKADFDMDKYINFNEFDALLLNSTPLSVFFGEKTLTRLERNKINYTFDHIADVAKINGPTFTYVHIVSPHQPFIFDPNGNPVEPKKEVFAYRLNGNFFFADSPPVKSELGDYRKRYIEQLIYINKRTIETIKNLLSYSESKPIIILQSDHGPGSELFWENPEKTNMGERMPNLNAYYVPENIRKNLYPEISPVNSFRLIFNYLFNTHLPLLEDKSYFATWSHPYKFINVTKNTTKQEMQ